MKIVIGLDSRLSKKHLIYIWTPFELTLKKAIVIFNRNVRFQILVSDNNLFTIFKETFVDLELFMLFLIVYFFVFFFLSIAKHLRLKMK